MASLSASSRGGVACLRHASVSVLRIHDSVGVGQDIDRLRASVRVLGMRHEAKLLALLTERGLKESDVVKAADAMFAQWTEEQREDMQRDVRRSRRDPLV